MEDVDFLVRRFEEHRSHLRAVAYRMLGSLSEADDAVQEAWLRLSRSDADSIENLGGWLTTVVGRLCLTRLRSRKTRREELWDIHFPEPVVSREDGVDPEQQALLADSVGVAMLVVLDTLAPAERLAFVLHDMFAVPFDDIASLVERSPAATRQLASRARRRVEGVATTPDADLSEQREVVDAFFAAARHGDFEALVAVLDPDVVARADGGPGVSVITRGAAAVAGNAMAYAQPPEVSRPVLVNGVPGVVVAPAGRVVSVLAFTIRAGKVVALDALTDPDRLSRLDLTALDA